MGSVFALRMVWGAKALVGSEGNSKAAPLLLHARSHTSPLQAAVASRNRALEELMEEGIYLPQPRS